MMIGTQSDEQLIKTISNPLQHTDSTKFSTEISTSKDVVTAALAVTLWYLGNQSAQRDIAERFDISPGHLSVLVKDVVDFLCCLSEAVIR